MTQNTEKQRLRNIVETVQKTSQSAHQLTQVLNNAQTQQANAIQASIQLGNNLLQTFGQIEQRSSTVLQVLNLVANSLNDESNHQRYNSNIQNTGTQTTAQSTIPYAGGRADNQIASILAKVVSNGLKGF